MKFAVAILLLAIGATCISAQYITSWGDVHNTRVLYQQKVEVASGWLQVRDRTVTYRSVSVFFLIFGGNCFEENRHSHQSSGSFFHYWFSKFEFLFYQFQNGPAIIRGIMHVDFNTVRSTPSISEGGIGQRLASVRIVSQRSQGINSTVRFYG